MSDHSDQRTPAEIWLDATPIDSHQAGRDALGLRGIEPHAITSAGIGTLWGRTRIVIPVRGEAGQVIALKSREPSLDKKTSRTLGAVKGGVMASRHGLAMLKRLARPTTVVIVEGETDLWTWESKAATRSNGGPLAILGVGQGLWSLEVAQRIPSGAVVYLRTDTDPQGERYADMIARTLTHRCVILRPLSDGCTDDSQRHQLGLLSPDPGAGCKRYFVNCRRPEEQEEETKKSGRGEWTDGQCKAYFERVLDTSTRRISAAAPGMRSSEAAGAAFVVGQYLHLPGASRADAGDALLKAAPTSREFTRREARGCIKRGLDAGAKKPIYPQGSRG